MHEGHVLIFIEIVHKFSVQVLYVLLRACADVVAGNEKRLLPAL